MSAIVTLVVVLDLIMIAALVPNVILYMRERNEQRRAMREANYITPFRARDVDVAYADGVISTMLRAAYAAVMEPEATAAALASGTTLLLEAPHETPVPQSPFLDMFGVTETRPRVLRPFHMQRANLVALN